MARSHLVRAGILLIVTLCARPLPARAADLVALVIGNSAYREVPTLPNPVNDATAMAARLRSLGFRTQLGIDLDLKAMRQAIRAFRDQAAGARLALVFYAGHGIQVAGGEDTQNYLLPTDARLADARDVEEEAVSLAALLDDMAEAGSRVVILDACRNNPFLRRMRARGGTRAVTRGLARIGGLDRGALVAFATEPGQVAADGTGPNSPFTAALLDNIGTPGIEIRTMLTRVRQAVVQRTGGEQQPWNNDGLLQEVYLAGPAVPPPPPTAPATDRDALFWRSVAGSSQASDFQAYLDAFPRGLYAPLALGRIAALRPPPPPAPRPALSPQAMDRSARMLLEELFARWSADNGAALAFAERAYAPTVMSHGEVIERSVLLARRRDFAAQWPSRTYRIRSVSSSCNGLLGKCHLDAVVDWQNANPAARAALAGMSKYTFSVGFVDGQPAIVAESSTASPR